MEIGNQTIFDLPDLVFLELDGVLGVAQWVEGSTRALFLPSYFLHAALVLHKGDDKEFNYKNGWEGTPWDWVA